MSKLSKERNPPVHYGTITMLTFQTHCLTVYEQFFILFFKPNPCNQMTKTNKKKLLNIIHILIRFPLRKIRLRGNHKPWISSSIRQLIRKRDHYKLSHAKLFKTIRVIL